MRLAQDLEDRRFVTVAEAAAYLGCPEDTIRRWIWRRQIRSFRLGRAVRIRICDLDNFAREIRPLR